jgi:hypothetical protein
MYNRYLYEKNRLFTRNSNAIIGCINLSTSGIMPRIKLQLNNGERNNTMCHGERTANRS